jgi:hypothetical protein
MLLAIAAVVLSLAALADGLSTVHFRRLGVEEINPLFGKTPSTPRIFGEGTALIAAEILTAALMSKHAPDASPLFAAVFFAQSGLHIYESIRNFKV